MQNHACAAYQLYDFRHLIDLSGWPQGVRNKRVVVNIKAKYQEKMEILPGRSTLTLKLGIIRWDVWMGFRWPLNPFTYAHAGGPGHWNFLVGRASASHGFSERLRSTALNDLPNHEIDYLYSLLISWWLLSSNKETWASYLCLSDPVICESEARTWGMLRTPVHPAQGYSSPTLSEPSTESQSQIARL